MPRLILIALLSMLSTLALAQDTKQFLFSRLTTRNGLTSDNVGGVQQDARGYIWTVNGNTIQRYDGHRLLTFRHEAGNPKSLPDGPIFQISVDQKNRLWLVYGNWGVGYLNLDNYNFYPVKVNATQEELHKTSGGMFTGSNGDIILVVRHRFLLTYSETANEFDRKYSPFQAPQGFLPVTMVEDRNTKSYWMGTQNGLVKYNLVKKTVSWINNNVDNDPYIEAMGKLPTALQVYIDKNKTLWAVSWPETGMKVVSFDPITKKTTEWQDKIGKILNDRYYSINGFHETRDGSLWINGHHILGKLRPDGSTFDMVPDNAPFEFGLRFEYIHHFYEDREDNIWLATDNGLYRFNPPSQLVMSIKNRRLYNDIDYSPDVTDVIQTREGDILVATWGSGVFSYDAQFRPKKVDHLYESHTKMGEGMTWALHQTMNGDIWRTQQGGTIFVWHAAEKRTEKIHDSVFENSTIRQVVEDRQGNLWFGTQRGYIVKWDIKTGKFKLQYKLESIVVRLLVDSTDHLWVCTEANGLFKIDTRNGKIVRRYTTSDTPGKGLRTNSTGDIIQYNDSLFVVVGGGLNIINIKSDTIKYFTLDNGLPTLSISNIIKDNDGYIWISTEMGIMSYHPWRRKLSQYNADDGVSSNNVNVASSGKLNDGSIVFGTVHDVMIFTPELLTVEDYRVPKYEITGVLIGSRRLDLDSLRKLRTIELSYLQNALTIEFSSLTYQNSYGSYYKMEGLEKDWFATDNTGEVTYNYIPPGHYTFNVAARDENAKFGEMTQLLFYIKPPFWKTWWFYSLLVITIITVLLLFDKQRIQRIHHEQGMRASIANNLHEEVNTVLQNISVLSEIARIKAETEPAQSKEYIYEIQQKSRNMVVAMSDVLWSINPANDNMQKTIDRINEVAEALENKHNVSVSVQTDKKVFDLNLTMDVRHELILIYKLAMVTLIEELKAPQTTVQLDYERSRLHMQIVSLNVQLPKNNNNITKNLNEIRNRANHTRGASVDIQSDDKGTWFLVELKV